MASLLNADEVARELSTLDGWQGDGREIARTAELPSFPAAIRVVDRVAEVAEEMDHHPDIDIRWRPAGGRAGRPRSRRPAPGPSCRSAAGRRRPRPRPGP